METSVLLFDNFETLDVFGPVEILGRLPEHFSIKFYSLNGGPVKNTHGVILDTRSISEIEDGTDLFIIPGGWGTRKEVDNELLIAMIRRISIKSTYVLTVCTGSALLARTGLLDNRQATSNKRALDWVMENGKDVKWVKKARWTADGKFYTSSGVSAGMDMCLGFLADIYDYDLARRMANEIEYRWEEDKEHDLFYDLQQTAN